MEIKVLTFNIHHGKGIDGKLNLDRIAKVIEDSDADIIGLNEVDRYYSWRSGYVDQLGWLSDRLGLNHAFGATVTLKSSKEPGAMLRQYGNALLSRFPVVFHKNHVFDVSPRKMEGRALLEVHVLVQGQLVKMYVTHLSLNPFLRYKQTDSIINKIMNHHQPVILLGDLNMKT
ncbi:MAG: endonuclease/exonuclease/phosphatase family protein, partial [Bacilli bacterium]